MMARAQVNCAAPIIALIESDETLFSMAQPHKIPARVARDGNFAYLAQMDYYFSPAIIPILEEVVSRVSNR